MDGIAPHGAFERGIEATLRRDRGVVLASLVAVAALAWLYLWYEAAAMSPMDMAGMPAGMPAMPVAFDAGALVLLFVMWTVMMVGMMLPSVAPTIALYATLVRKNGERGTVLPATWVFASGYLAVWTAFSLAATALHASLEHAALLTPMMVSANPWLSAGVLIGAGIYQWLPVKERCLSRCRNPLQFFLTHWRPGKSGAFRMGAEHGMYCVGCCWMLMLLLFVAGVMNLLWVAIIAGFVFLEKLLPNGRWTSRLASVGLVVFGVYLLLQA